ncbi:MAG TPA: DUF1786 family protein [Syntrophobacteraceae bacterium]|nr:DUF1786 family protein [Syntrophobacteraceae bacterium]
MGRYLLLDVGAGTLDVLFYDDISGIHYKAVVRSPVLYLAERAQKIAGDLLITGVEMGGGALLDVLSRHARNARVVVCASAASTLSHNPDRILEAGLTIIEDSQAAALAGAGGYTSLNLSDFPHEHLERIVKSFGVPFEFDIVGVCAQDHGTPPAGKSHLDFRHEIIKSALDREPSAQSLLYEKASVPVFLNRLKSAAQTASTLPCTEVYVMDSGIAAILGACMDFRLRGKRRFIVLDIATSHTVCAAIEDEQIAGLVEYHTRDLNLEKLESLLVHLADGKLRHRQVLAEGGHGAYIRRAFGYEAVELIVATGPKRRLVENSKLPIAFGAPLGDNMMTGTTGLLEAIKRRKGLEFSLYL